ncbi:MAG: hypothetical protein ACOCRX_07495 [Candidatus Woesearchaeota archaeon]
MIIWYRYKISDDFIFNNRWIYSYLNIGYAKTNETEESLKEVIEDYILEDSYENFENSNLNIEILDFEEVPEEEVNKVLEYLNDTLKKYEKMKQEIMINKARIKA